MRRIASMAQGYQICHCEERSDVAISQNPTGQQGSHRRNRNCLPEIATSAYGLLAMTNLVAGAVGGVHRNLQLPMALTERRYSQTWRRIRSAMPFPFRQCLPEIATAPLGPRNDKLEGLAPQNACRKDCQPARRSLSAATLFSRAAALYNERRYRRNRCAPF